MRRSRVIVRTDGAVLGNPGPGAIAYLVEEENGQIVATGSEYIGETTNNVAEYRALIAALRRVRELGFRKVRIFSDSLLMVQQLNGKWQVRERGLEPLYAEALSLLGTFEERSIEHVSREKNSDADRLAAKALAEVQTKFSASG